MCNEAADAASCKKVLTVKRCCCFAVAVAVAFALAAQVSKVGGWRSGVNYTASVYNYSHTNIMVFSRRCGKMCQSVY